MPMIEGKKFPYTKAGKAAAKKYAAKHEKTESKREREMEYGKPKKGKKKCSQVSTPTSAPSVSALRLDQGRR